MPDTLASNTAGTLVSSTLYNALGSLTSLTLGNSAVTTYGYYGTGGTNDTTGGYYGRLYEIKTVNAASTVLQDLKQTWDAAGNLIQKQDGVNSETESYTYDFLDRLKKASGAYSETYSYDKLGNITAKDGVLYSYGSQPHAVTTVGSDSYTYDANGNLLSGGGRTYTWDAENRLSQVSTSPALYESYTDYSTYGSLTGGYYYAQTFTPQTSHTLTSFKMLLYNYSATSGATSGTLTGYLRATNTSGVPTSTNLATTAAISESSLSAAWTEVTFTFTSGYFLAAGTQYTLVVKPTVTGLRLRYNASGAYTGGQRYYSSSGSSWTSSSAYDYYFQEYGTITTSYVYDGDGQRVQKTENGVVTVYPNQYYEVSGTTVTSNYYLGSKLVAVSLDGTLSYILQDHLGSTSTTLNSSGAIDSTIKYFPYGSTRSSSGTLPTNKLFTGQQRDNATSGSELYYYGARYYDPEIGRFISADSKVPDPLNSQSLNRYSYCLNNPLKYTDPTGHGWWSIALDIASIVFDCYELSVNPSLGNLGLLALDVALTCIPVVPAGVGPVVKGATQGVKLFSKGEKVVKGAEKAAEGAKYATDAVKALQGSSDIGAFLTKAGKNADKVSEIKEAFQPGAKIVKLENDTVVYRYWGGNNSVEKGEWVTTELLSDPKNQLSLPPSNTAEFVTSYTIPAGTEVVAGNAAAMEKWGTAGGGFQIYIPDINVLY